MSKFHVGDEVTLHFTEEQLEQFALKSEVNLALSGEWTIQTVYNSGPGRRYYDYDGQLYSVSNGEASWDVPEEVLRPADIKALDSDPVNHPSHYTRFGVEVIEITEHLSFNAGNAVKYLARAGLKDPSKHVEDLKKALWYTQREIARVEKEAAE